MQIAADATTPQSIPARLSRDVSVAASSAIFAAQGHPPQRCGSGFEPGKDLRRGDQAFLPSKAAERRVGADQELVTALTDAS